MIQKFGLLQFSITLATAVGETALTSGAAALGIYARKENVNKITDSSNTKACSIAVDFTERSRFKII